MKTKTLEQRKKEASRILKKYPERVPVIISKDHRCKLDDIKKKKYLIPNDVTVGQFIYILRKNIQLKPEQGIFLFVKNSTMVPTNSNMGTVYHNYHSEDDFLYITYASENTFGNANFRNYC